MDKLCGEYSRNLDSKSIEGGEYESIDGFTSKCLEHALRIATTLSLFDDIATTTLTYTYIRMGMNIVDYYINEAMKMFGDNVEDTNIILAEKLLGWIKHKWNEEYISLPDIYQKGFEQVRTRKDAMRVVRVLEEHGYLRKIEGSIEIKGCNRREAWKIKKY